MKKKKKTTHEAATEYLRKVFPDAGLTGRERREMSVPSCPKCSEPLTLSPATSPEGDVWDFVEDAVCLSCGYYRKWSVSCYEGQLSSPALEERRKEGAK